MSKQQIREQVRDELGWLSDFLLELQKECRIYQNY